MSPHDTRIGHCVLPADGAVRAECSCGWVWRWRTDPEEAERDAGKHLGDRRSLVLVGGGDSSG